MLIKKERGDCKKVPNQDEDSKSPWFLCYLKCLLFWLL